jgi:hypothetical protein
MNGSSWCPGLGISSTRTGLRQTSRRARPLLAGDGLWPRASAAKPWGSSQLRPEEPAAFWRATDGFCATYSAQIPCALSSLAGSASTLILLTHGPFLLRQSLSPAKTRRACLIRGWQLPQGFACASPWATVCPPAKKPAGLSNGQE